MSKKSENLHLAYNYIIGSGECVKIDELSKFLNVDRRSTQNYIRELKIKDPNIRSIPGRGGGIVYKEY